MEFKDDRQFYNYIQLVPADSLLYTLNRNRNYELVAIYQEIRKRKVFYRIIWRIRYNANS